MSLKSNIASIILAGGESRRMGRPKLSLKLKGKTLLELAISKAKNVSHEVIVVVGAYPDIYTAIAKEAGARVLENANWQAGLGTTLKAGLLSLDKNSNLALALLADQPFVEEAHLNGLIHTQRNTDADLVFSSYDGVHGPPVAINQTLFQYANTLKGKCGAKALIQENSKVEAIKLERYFDIDTPEDAKKHGVTFP